MTRRANGEGTIHKRSGLYEIRLRVKNAEGKSVRISIPGGKTRKEAQKRLETFKNQNCFNAEAKQTFSQWLNVWIEKYSASKADSTVSLYKKLIARHIVPKLGNIALADLKPSTFSAFFTDLSKVLAPRSIMTINSILNAALNQAVLDEVIFRNVLQVVKKPKIEPAHHKVFTEEEFHSFYIRCLESAYKFPYLLMLFGGLRRGEALGMDWKSVNLEKKTITVRQQLTELDGAIKLGPLKTAKSYRTISLPDSIIKEFANTPKAQRKGLVYSSKLKNPRKFVADFKVILSDLGIEGMRPHDLRHTNASHLLMEKIGLPMISARLGHSNTKITGDVYSHEVSGSGDEAAKALENKLQRFKNNEANQ